MNKIKSVTSSTTYIERIDSLEAIQEHLNADNTYKVFAVCYGRLVWGSFNNGFALLDGNFCIDDIESIRIFDPERELMLYRPSDPKTGRTASHLVGRLRSDCSTGDQCYCKDAYQILIGNKILSEIDDYVTLAEDRGFELRIPRAWLDQDVSKCRLRLHTRNYLGQWDNGSLSYEDCRFVDVIQHIEGE